MIWLLLIPPAVLLLFAAVYAFGGRIAAFGSIAWEFFTNEIPWLVTRAWSRYWRDIHEDKRRWLRRWRGL